MRDPAPSNLLTLWADRVAEALVVGGVEEVVVSPGSRNTPFVLAFARHPGLRLHSVLDERAAGFFALGRARARRRPVALSCTSGSALTHYFPAVLEASESGVPLVVLSADRPPELHGSGAPQTADQTRIFGSHVRASLDLGLPSATRRAVAAAPRKVLRALAYARGARPGPVHLNLPARKPLEPVGDEGAAERELREAVEAEGPPRTIHPAPRRAPSDADLDDLVESLARAERPALVLGPRALGASRDAVFATRLPRFVEASSQARFGAPRDGLACERFDLWLRDPRAPRPDWVLEVGRVPVSSAYGRWLDADGPRERVLISDHPEADPSHRGTVLLADPDATLAALAERVTGEAPGAWREALAAQEARARRIVLEELEPWCEGRAVQRAVAAVPPGGMLALGNSLPIRHADRFVDGTASAHPLDVYASRGVNGIDGWLAQLAGAVTGDPRPTVAVLGDVTFAHDLGALPLVRRAEAPLVIVVLDNAGGRIFEQLPLHQHLGRDVSEATFGLFLTPPDLPVTEVAGALGIPARRVEDVTDLDAALADGLGRAGPTVVHARFAPEAAGDLEARLRARILA
jgi:2-succinyl-5-enolpyruvyl-6-hydroxy-3-cyclohexene-1-carboxylate synthase